MTRTTLYVIFRRGTLSLALLCLGASMAQGQEAVTQVKSLLTGFGVKGPIRLQRFGSVSRPGTVSQPGSAMTAVEVTDREGHPYSAYLQEDGSSIHIERTDSRPSGWSPVPLPDGETLKRARRWLAVTGAKDTAEMPQAAGSDKGAVRLHFPILRNGHPFVSFPHYGYDFAFDDKSGAFLTYDARTKLPPVSPTPAKLDRAGALAALKTIWDTKITPHAIREMHWRRVWYTLKGEPELGYYLPKGQEKAILVWRISYISERDVGSAIQGGDSGMLIDAVTGEQIPTPTVP